VFHPEVSYRLYLCSLVPGGRDRVRRHAVRGGFLLLKLRTPALNKTRFITRLCFVEAIILEKAYDPKSFEDKIYALWQESGAFQPKAAEGGERPYTIVIPPPNVTGILHMGHALNITLQDVVVRYRRMTGVPALWVPGTDHAGIATQNVVEKRLRARGLSRRELGRERFTEETWKVKEEHHKIITEQIKKMGASVDWTRERFTLDDGLAAAVREVFVSLYERGLLYRGQYLVNWCSSCGTALSDDEVEHRECPGRMYHILYPRSDGHGAVEIATTRPETLLGDTAVAVHPDDPRGAGLAGKTLVLPLTGREIPVVTDSYVDMEFGTGFVKITPAHDPNDREVGLRHGLPVINILNGDGTLNGNVPERFRGLGVKAAREAVLAALKAENLLVKEEEITHSVGHCYRCGTVIEPFLSEQWFVRMKPLAEKALAAWERGDLIFYPRKWENTYRHWLGNIRDWCVSRQLWWGHRIPVWYCENCGRTIVARAAPASCPECGCTKLRQDEDVLDTWFSSWLWPFSTLGWGVGSGEWGVGDSRAAGAADLAVFYPTTALITAYDIIFFWVARMIMAGLEFTGQAPFRDIYIHGLLRDKQGRKMSKSLGNGIDPLEIVNAYGADALKFTLAFLCAQGQDILIDKESFKLGSKFANKVWNASRYILMNLEGRTLVKSPEMTALDRWIYSRLAAAAVHITAAFESYRYNDAASRAYEYFRNDFCDWYVEATKIFTKSGSDTEKNRAVTVLIDVLRESLRLLHPFIPFVTEEIYGKLPAAEDEKALFVYDSHTDLEKRRPLLITSPYPASEHSKVQAALIDEKAESDFARLQDIVRSLRTLRSECTIAPEKKLMALVYITPAGAGESGADEAQGIGWARDIIMLLANLSELEFASGKPEKARTAGAVGAPGTGGAGIEAFLFIAGAADIEQLKARWAREAAKDRKFAAQLEAKLANGDFLKNAPTDLVAGEREKLAGARARIARLEGYAALC